MQYALENGVSFKLIQGNILNLKPALVITKEEIDGVLEVFRAGLMTVTSGCDSQSHPDLKHVSFPA